MKIIETALSVLGIGLGYRGYEVSGSLSSQFTDYCQFSNVLTSSVKNALVW